MDIEQKKPIEFATLHNTTDRDFTFMWDSAIYSIKAGESKQFIDYIAVHGAKKLADVYAKTANKDEKEVLKQTFLQNIPLRDAARKLNIDIDKITREIDTKEKEKARIINLEAQIAEMRKQMQDLIDSKNKNNVENKVEEQSKKSSKAEKAEKTEK